MTQVGSYNVQNFSTSSEGEIRRLNAQLDLFWEKEFALYCRFGLRDGMKIMDCGCGPGYLTQKLLGMLRGSTAVSVEVDPSLVKVAKERLKSEIEAQRCTVVENSILNLELADNSFDFIVTRLVVEHVPDPVAACRELYRVLKPGGIVVVVDNDFEMHVRTFPMVSELNDLYNAYCKARSEAGGNPKIGRELPVVLTKAGYSVVDLEIICAHSSIVGDAAFLKSEGPGIPTQLVHDGYLAAETYQKLTAHWHEMLKNREHVIVRQLYVATGKKIPDNEKKSVAADAGAKVEKVKVRGNPVQSSQNTRGERNTFNTMCELVAVNVAKLLGYEMTDAINYETALTDLGIDSELALELQDSLSSALQTKHPLPATLVFNYPTVIAIARFLVDLEKQESGKAHGEVGNADASRENNPSIDIESLSDSEIEKKLLDKLNLLDEV